MSRVTLWHRKHLEKKAACMEYNIHYNTEHRCSSYQTQAKPSHFSYLYGSEAVRTHSDVIYCTAVADGRQKRGGYFIKDHFKEQRERWNHNITRRPIWYWMAVCSIHQYQSRLTTRDNIRRFWKPSHKENTLICRRYALLCLFKILKCTL